VTAGLGLGDDVDAADDAPSRVGDDTVQPAVNTQRATDETAIETDKPRAATSRR
jgi:hypothetical protein